jgi:hypothetical protein
MGVDVFNSYRCPFRKDSETHYLQNLLRLQRHLAEMESGANPNRTVRVQLFDGDQVREQVYTQTDLRMASAKLTEVYSACESCPANLKKAFGIRGTIGCHAYISCPMDEFAERILHETLAENVKPERLGTEQSNLLRALVGSTDATGSRWREMAAKGGPLSPWGSRPVVLPLEQGRFEVSVHALSEMLFLYPRFPARAVDDILSFFRSFFAVVAAYVSTPEGKLDPARNAEFWSRSRALNELNLYIQLLKHASRLGVGVGASAA